MVLAEELLLIALDDESGRARAASGTLDYGLAAALLLDLSAAGAVAADGDRITATGDVADPLLRDALAAIRESARPRPARHWVQRLPKALKPLRDRVAARLVEHGTLREEHRKVLGLLDRSRYVEADDSAEDELRARLHAALVDGATPDSGTAMLLSLLVPLDLVKAVVPKEARRDAKRRAKEVADRGVVGTGLEHVVRDLQASVAAAGAAGAAAAGAS